MSSIKNLYIKLDNFELVIPELQIPEVGITAIQGNSGSGKTTFLKTLIGIHKPLAWTWTFKGQILSQLSISERRLGVVFQSYDLFPHLTAEQNVLLVLNARNSKEVRDEELCKMQDFKEQLNLNSCWKTIAYKLSGGEKQRIALLRALVSNPRLMLLDEPFAALDIGLRKEARRILGDLIKKLDIPVYLVTHDEEDVQSLAQNLIRIQNGKILD